MNQKLWDVSTTKYFGNWRGIVMNNVDPNQKGACQIQCMPMFNSIAMANLPWAIPATPLFDGAGTGTGSMMIPKIGTKVWGWFEEGDIYQPVYFAEAPDYVVGQPSVLQTAGYPANYPNVKALQTSGGFYVTLDDKVGDFSINFVRDWIANIGRNLTFTTIGNITLVVTNLIANISNNLTIAVSNIASLTDITGQKLCQSGMMSAFAGSSAPAGWLLCDGSSYSRTTYAYLFTIIGTTYGSVDGSHFNVPDMRGQVPVGIGGTLSLTLGQEFGEVNHTLTINEMPSHTHGISNGAQASGGSGFDVANAVNTIQSAPTGGGLAHNNVQPSLGINYIIKI